MNILSSGLIGHTSLHLNASLMSDGGQQPPRITLMCTQGWGLRPWNYTIPIIQSASLLIVAQIKQILFGRNNNEVVLQIRIISYGGRSSKSAGWWSDENMIRSATSPSLCSSVDVWRCNGFISGVWFGPRQVFLCVMSACIIPSRPQAVLLWLRMQHVPLLGSVMALWEQWKVRFARITGLVELLARTRTHTCSRHA